MQINGPIDISGLISELDKVEGVQSVPTLEVKNFFSSDDGYSGNEYDVNKRKHRPSSS